MSAGPKPKVARNAHIKKLRDEGLSLNEIVWKLEEDGFERISVQRVHRLLKKMEKANDH